MKRAMLFGAIGLVFVLAAGAGRHDLELGIETDGLQNAGGRRLCAGGCGGQTQPGLAGRRTTWDGIGTARLTYLISRLCCTGRRRLQYRLEEQRRGCHGGRNYYRRSPASLLAAALWLL